MIVIIIIIIAIEKLVEVAIIVNQNLANKYNFKFL